MNKHSITLTVLLLTFVLALGPSTTWAGSGTVTVQLKASDGITGVEGAAVSYYKSGKQLLGYTDAAGSFSAYISDVNTTTIYLEPTSGGTRTWLLVDPATGPTLTAQMVAVTIGLQTCEEGALTGEAIYYKGGWKTLGSTPATVDLLPYTGLGPGQGSYDFRVVYNGRTSATWRQDVAVNQMVIFKTTKVTSSFVGNTYYYNNGWQLFSSPSELMGGTENISPYGTKTADFKFGGTGGSYPTYTFNITGCNVTVGPPPPACTPPSITVQPSDATNCVGESVTFSVTADGTGPLAYQWRKDGSDISGATSSTLTINPVLTSDAGTYNVVVSGACSPSATSDAATLTIKSYTLSINATNGSVAADPSPGPHHCNTVVHLTATPAIGYHFVDWSGDATGRANPVDVTMDANKAVTANFAQDEYTLTVNVLGNGVVTKDPDQSVYYYNNVVTLNATADPGWTFGGFSPSSPVTITGNTNVTATFTQNEYTLTVTTVGSGSVSQNNPGPYHLNDVVQLTATPVTGWTFSGWSGNASGSTNPLDVTMDAAKNITATFVCTPPSITSQPSDATKCAGESVTFSVTAAGTGPLTYQWKKGDSDIPGATASSYTINPVGVSDAGSYAVVVGGACAPAVASNAATLTVNTSPVVTTQPADQTVLAGCSATFSAAASGSPTPTVQWEMSTNGGTAWTNISGATTTTLTVSSVTTSQSGRKYHAVFTNSCNSTTTNAATLTVQPSATLKVQFIVYVLLDNRCRPKVQCVPVEKAEVRVYTLKEVCANNLVVSGQPKIWGKIYDGLDGPDGSDPGCSYLAKGVTDKNGVASIIVPPTTTKPDIDYVVIASTCAFDDVKTVDEPDALYSGVRIACIKAGEQKVVKLRRLRLFSGKIVPAQYLEEYGTYLAIVEPEYMDWDSDQEQYPIVMESDGDWSVTTTVEPPEGFVSDYPKLSIEVDDTTAAIQFTLTDVGSKWTSAGVKHEIRHKGKVKVRDSGVPMFDKRKNKNKNKKGNSAFNAIGGAGQAIMSGFVPAEYALYQNYPDPFNPSTVLQFDLPEPAVVTLKVYNVLGQQTVTLLDEASYQPGRHRVTFNASRLASGVYVYRITAGPFVDTKKMLLLK